MEKKELHIRAIIGLGNPGSRFFATRHNIGFRVLDELARSYSAQWENKELMDITEIQHDGERIILIKPQTFMNESGKVIPFLAKKGIDPDQILVIHDELEMPFGKLKIKLGGSAKGHNGLRSIINYIGKDFPRLSFGIGRPADREQVGNYVLQPFTQHEEKELVAVVDQAVRLIDDLIAR